MIRHFITPVLLTVLAIAQSSPVSAFELQAGFAAVEEGDDRMRPGAALHVGFNEFYQGRMYYYGRELGPIREETYLVSGGRRFGLFGSPSVTASIGAAMMNERVVVDYGDANPDGTPVDPDQERREDNYNVGAAFGIAWSLPKSARPLAFTVSWDSHVFPAGVAGFFFLSSGRKQTISLTAGVAL